MIGLVDAPFVITLKDGEAADDGEILLLGISGPDTQMGLILAARELIWHPLDQIIVETALLSYVRDEGEPAPEE